MAIKVLREATSPKANKEILDVSLLLLLLLLLPLLLPLLLLLLLLLVSFIFFFVFISKQPGKDIMLDTSKVKKKKKITNDVEV